MVPQTILAGTLVGGVMFQMYYGLVFCQDYQKFWFYIIGKVWVSRFHIWWLFCDGCNTEREMYTFVTEKCIFFFF